MKKTNLALAVGGILGGAVAIKLLTRAATVRWEDAAQFVPHSDRSDFVAVDGVRIHYQEFGEPTARPILLIHGYTASAYVWREAAPRLADAGFRVIAVDMPGSGYSDKPRWFDYSITGQARYMARLLDRLGIGRAVVVGSSYGGAVASVLALDYAERVERLVLVSSVCNDDLLAHPVLRLASVPLLGEVITPFFADSVWLHRHRMRGNFARANLHLASRERVDAIRRPLLAADGHHSLLATSRSWSACRIEQDAHLIAQPTLLIWGEEDAVVPVTEGCKLRERIPDSRLVVINDCGHLPHEERSEMFAELVGEFCSGG